MDKQELTHHGILGMKWGRRRYQNKDGSLTPAGKKRYGDDSEKKEETPEEKRARLLKSTNAQELYKNRDALTTQEIRERMDRINVEKQLGSMAAKDKKTAMDRVDQVLKIGKKVNEVYEFTNTPVMKALKKQLGLEKEAPKEPETLADIYKNRAGLSNEVLKKALNRATTERAIKKILDQQDEERKEAVKKAFELKVASEKAKAAADAGKAAAQPYLMLPAPKKENE